MAVKTSTGPGTTKTERLSQLRRSLFHPDDAALLDAMEHSDTLDPPAAPTRQRTAGLLVTEVHRAKSTLAPTPSAKATPAPTARPGTLERSDSDLETELGDVGGLKERLHDLKDIGLRIYERRCADLGVVPISLVVRNFGEPELRLNHHQCGPKGAEALACPLPYHITLAKLDLTGNGIGDQGVRHLIPRLSETETLREVNFSENNISLDGARWICRLATTNRNLQALSLAGNHLGDQGADVLADILESDVCSLTKLNLSGTDLGVEAGLKLGPLIASNTTLETLDLSWNHIRLKGAVAIGMGIKENSQLQSVDLGWNGFGEKGAEALGMALKENNTLRSLDISGNRLSDTAIILLAGGIKVNEGLHKLKIVKNYFSEVGAKALLAAINDQGTASLKHVDMKGVIIDKEFRKMLAAAQDSRDLEVRYDHIVSKKNPDPGPLVVRFLQKAKCQLRDLFPGITEDSEDRCATKEEFFEKLRSQRVPLADQMLHTLASDLDKHERGLLDLTPLFKLEAQMMQAA